MTATLSSETSVDVQEKGGVGGKAKARIIMAAWEARTTNGSQSGVCSF